MKRITCAGLLAVALLFTSAAAARAAHAAIAYSQSTGSIGYSYNCSSRAQAESLAMDHCSGDDAQVVVWVENGYCALAVGDEAGAYGAAWGHTKAEAELLAVQACSRYTTNPYVTRWVFSGR